MRDKINGDEGGLLPLAILLGLMCLVLAYGIQRGFLSPAKLEPGRKIRLVLVTTGSLPDGYRRVVDRFERQHPDIGVDLRQSNGPNYYQKLLVMMASGNPPDLMWMGEGFGEFAQRGAFLDLSERIERDVDLRPLLPEAVRSYRINGRQFGIPFLLDVAFIVYNRDLFDAAGLPYPANDWNYDQFLQTARRLTLRQDGQTLVYGYDGFLDQCLFGSQFISEDGARAACDAPAAIQYLQTNDDLFREYRVAPAFQSKPSLDRYALFATGRVAMMQAHTWELSSLRQQCGSVRWGYVLNPKVNQRGESASTQAVLISAQTRFPDAAWELCKEFLSLEFEAFMAPIGLPSNLTVARELATSGEEAFDHLPTLLAAVGELYFTPRVAHLAEARQLFSEAQESVWTGNASAQEAAQRASRSINRMLQQQRRYGF